MTPTLDPPVESLLEYQQEAPVPPLDALSIEGMRQQFASWNEPDGTPEVGNVRDLSIDGPGGDLNIRVYVPDAEGPHPLLVYYHGGGWVVGDLDTHDSICRSLTTAVDCITIAVDYRRAPDNPFPAAVEDAQVALKWVAEHGSDLGGDTSQIAVAGDSSGGTLAAVTAILDRDNHAPDVTAQVLAYPVTNYHQEMDSYSERAEYGIASDPNWFKDLYLESLVDGYNPLAFPLQTPTLVGLADALVVTSEFDPLRDDGIEYASRLSDAGVPTDHQHFEGMVHGFLHYDHLDAQSEAMNAISEFLTNAFKD